MSAPDPETEAARLMQALVSRRCGLVRDMAPQGRGPEEPCPPHLWTATLAHFDFRAAGPAERLNAGKGRSRAEAQLSALGEAIERYSAFHWDAARVHVHRAAAGAITPADLVLYSDAQYAAGRLPYPRWSDEAETSWITGVELPGGDPVDLPAALVYLVSPTPRPVDHVTAITSNGLAAGADGDRAVIGGLYEVIERDALMITWANRLPATLVETPETGCMAASVIRHYARFGVGVRLLWLASDQAPVVVMAVADNPDPAAQGARVIGMGCDLDAGAAIDKAVFELCQARPSMAVRMARGDTAGRLRTYADVRDLDDHPLFHALPEQRAEFDFLLASGKRTTLDRMPRSTAAPTQALGLIVAGLRAAGARVAFCDITTPDIAALGPRVVRCVATGFQPIHFGHGEGRFGGGRLFDAPVRWGLRSAPLTEDRLNPCPHPLA